MRYSPYEMEDYGLRHGAGTVAPAEIAPTDEALWNLCWASIPEYDAYLDLRYEDFEGFRALARAFPYSRKQRASALIASCPRLGLVLATGTPREAAQALPQHATAISTIFGVSAAEWVTTVAGRLELAQTLVDVRDAAEVCRNVVRVDFRRGKRA